MDDEAQVQQARKKKVYRKKKGLLVAICLLAEMVWY